MGKANTGQSALISLRVSVDRWRLWHCLLQRELVNLSRSSWTSEDEIKINGFELFGADDRLEVVG